MIDSNNWSGIREFFLERAIMDFNEQILMANPVWLFEKCWNQSRNQAVPGIMHSLVSTKGFQTVIETTVLT